MARSTQEKMNLLRDLLQVDDPRDARERLERFLGTMEDHQFRREEVRLTTRGDPVLSILAQHKTYRIYRTKSFAQWTAVQNGLRMFQN
jgi:hypothetical protein